MTNPARRIFMSKTFDSPYATCKSIEFYTTNQQDYCLEVKFHNGEEHSLISSDFVGVLGWYQKLEWANSPLLAPKEEKVSNW